MLDASIQLLEEKGFDAFTVQEVSQRADVSVGAIYARFGSKESLLAVHRHALVTLRPEDSAFSVVDGRPARGDGRCRARARRGLPCERKPPARVHAPRCGRRRDLDAGVRQQQDLARQFEAALLAHRDAITHRDPDKAVDVAFRIAFATFTRRVMSGPTFESDRVIDWDDLVHEVGAVCAAYLLDEPSPARAQSSASLIPRSKLLTSRATRAINSNPNFDSNFVDAMRFDRTGR